MESSLKNNCKKNLGSSCQNIQTLLKEIYNGYKEFIRAHAGKTDMFTKEKQFKRFTFGEVTINNISNRKEDLEKKIFLIKQDNERLKRILASKESKPVRETTYDSFVELLKFKVDSEEQEDENDQSFLSKLCIQSCLREQDLSLERLQENHEELCKKLEILKSSVTNMYNKKEKYTELKEELIENEGKLTGIQDCNSHLKTVIEERQNQIQVLKEELGMDCLDEKPSRRGHRTEPLLPLFEEKKFDSDEPKDQKLVSSCILYLNRFYFEFQKGNFKLAAQLAANSPHGILRNYTTYLMFKNNADTHHTKQHPSFHYCEALIKTSFFDGIVEENLSIEIIKCGISYGDATLVKFWLSSVILTMSKSVADFLYSTCKCELRCYCAWTLLALQVYGSLDNLTGMILCHLKLNNFNHVKRYLYKNNISKMELKKMMTDQPYIQLSYLLCDVRVDKCCITVPGVVRCLLDNKMHENLINLLLHIVFNSLHGKSLFDCLLHETVDDDMGDSGWDEVVDLCHLFGKQKLAEELHACLITRECLENASIFCLRDYIS